MPSILKSNFLVLFRFVSPAVGHYNLNSSLVLCLPFLPLLVTVLDFACLLVFSVALFHIERCRSLFRVCLLSRFLSLCLSLFSTFVIIFNEYINWLCIFLCSKFLFVS